jgi:predicted ATPase/class 3 adenylate cyclase/DNA-binding CsgD family transcriptional regulator
VRDLADRRLPEGTVTLLLADVEGSTLLWERDSSAARPALSQLDALADEAIATCNGARPVEQGEGDSFVAAFARASDAVACALELQLRLEDTPLRVRMGLHTGEVDVRDGQRYDGPTIIRAARLRDLGHGGQVLVSNLTREATVDGLPEGAEMLDLGPQSLKGLDRPERVFQLVHPSLQREFPPLRSAAHTQGNLPVQLTALVGRSREIDEVIALLGEQRLLTLTGAGGCGKTRLAVEVANRAHDDFPDGVFFCDLGSLSDPDAVAATLCQAVGTRSQHRDQIEAACRHLASMRALVILDNCEHLIDACASIVDAVLRRCPDVTVLTTTREPLGVEGEVSWRVPSLPTPSAGERMDVATAESFDAVRLFVQRARQVRPRFELERPNLAAVIEICARLEGIPLAIVLAAARVRTLSVEQIASGLSDRFRLLGRGARTALPRQQTLEASVAWSHELLSEEQRIVLRRLSIFAGGFSLAAAEHVVEGDGVEGAEVLELLTQLVDRSLVNVDETGAEARYWLLETIRQFARARLIDASEVEETARRHLEWFERWTRSRYAKVWTRDADRVAVAVDFDREYDNIRTAIEWSLADGATRQGLRLAQPLESAWTLTAPAGRMREWRRWLEQLLAADGEVDVRTRAGGLCALAAAAMFLGDGETTIRAGREAAALARECSDLAVEHLARSCVFQVLTVMDPPAGLHEIESAIEDAQALGLEQAVSAHSNFLGFARFTIQGNLREATRILEDLERDPWVTPGQVANGRLCYLGFMRALLGDVDGGVRHIEESWDRVVRTNNQHSFGAQVPSVFGLVELYRGGNAQPLLERGYELASASGFASLEVMNASYLAFFHLLAGHTADADRLLASLGDGLDASNWVQWEMLSCVRALAHLASGDLDNARDVLHVSDDPGFLQVFSMTRITKALVARADGETAEAESHVCDELAFISLSGAVLYAPDCLELVAGLRTDIGAHEDAARLFGAAAAGRERLGTVRVFERFLGADDAIAKARDELGLEAFEAAWGEAAATSLEDAVAYAMRGRGPRQRPASGWDSLTPTERQVVDLVTEGLTNKQIGERLFISPRTVSTHLSHVFAKLGVSSRSELTSAAAKRA